MVCTFIFKYFCYWEIEYTAVYLQHTAYGEKQFYKLQIYTNVCAL